jgi:hypothetical protein
LRADHRADQAEQVDRALGVVDLAARFEVVQGRAGAMETWTPPSRLSLVILAVESEGSLTVGSMLSLATAR